MSQDPHSPTLLAGQRVALVGRFAAMSRRQLQRLVREHGGVTVAEEDAPTLVVQGEHEPPPERPLGSSAAGPMVLCETDFYSRLGLVEQDWEVRSLYTPAMLAELLGVSASIVRHWVRQQLLAPSREVKRLAYFDFAQMTAARRLADFGRAGLTARSIREQVERLAACLPAGSPPLDLCDLTVEGKRLLLHRGGAILEASGQQRFDFESAPTEEPADVAPLPGPGTLPLTVSDLVRLAGELEDEGRLPEAAEAFRAALAAEGPDPALNFQLAEILYRMGELPAARERYYVAIELDEEYVEARSNLGCVLAELGEHDLARAAFEGAIAQFEDFADAHYHLARLLEDLGQDDEAHRHWRKFLLLAPDSPWASLARQHAED